MDIRPPPAVRMILVRHSEPADTPVGTFLGRTDPDLGEHGRSQAVSVAAAVAQRLTASPQAIISSPLRRARSSAVAVSEACGAPVTYDDRLREIDFGQWDGMTLEPD